MVSAIFVGLLAIGLSAASSQLITDDIESFIEGPISDRRTFKHGKPLKLLPLIKKHKKFAKLVPHVFSKASYSEVPIIHETPNPVYKVHRYQGIEVKPLPDVYSTPETVIESHSFEPPSGAFVPTYDNYLSGPVHSSSVLLYPLNEKPIFSASIFAPLPPPPKPIFSFVRAHPVSSIVPSSAFSSVSIARPALNPIPALQAPVFTPIPPSTPPQPIFSSNPIKIQAPALPPLPAQSSALFTSIPIKIQAPLSPSVFASSSGNVFSPVSVKIPAPILPAVPTPTPAPVFPSISSPPSPTPVPAFSSLPVSLPPVQFSVVPSPTPSLSLFSPPAPALPSISVSAAKQILEPEYTYPPTGTPISSYIKDISLSDFETKDSPLATIETPKYEEITPSINIDNSKNADHVLGGVRNENGFLQKIKGWKADKANAALSHFTHFKHKPVIQPAISISHPPHKTPVEVSIPQVSIHPIQQFPGPSRPLPLATAPAFFPSTSFFPPAKYENFPPNNIESPPLFNSYGIPIPHNSYALTHISHDRLSSAASEEDPAILPLPSAEKKESNHEVHQPLSQIQQEFQTQNFQSQSQSRETFQNHPVYVAENDKTIKEESKTTEDAQSEVDDYEIQKESKADEAATNAHHYLNHKE